MMGPVNRWRQEGIDSLQKKKTKGVNYILAHYFKKLTATEPDKSRPT